MHLVLTPPPPPPFQILHKYCFKFLLRRLYAPKEIENTYYRCSEIDKETFLIATLLAYGCVFPEPIRRLRPDFQAQKYGNVYGSPSRLSASFYAPVEISDGNLGLYSGPGKIAEERCKAGTVDNVGEGVGRINSNGYAVLAVDQTETPECFPMVD